jgi:hypothetical protein
MTEKVAFVTNDLVLFAEPGRDKNVSRCRTSTGWLANRNTSAACLASKLSEIG